MTPVAHPEALSFDPRDVAFLEDPYPSFDRLREAAPVHWHEGLGQFIAVSYEAADAVLRERGLGRIWRDREPAELFPAFNMLHQNSILESEPPTHTRLRRLLAGAFSRGHVDRMRPWILELAGGLVAGTVERLRSGESVDFLAEVAEPLPVEVIAQLLNIDPADRHLLRPWSNAIVKMYEYGLSREHQAAAEEAARQFVAYLRAVVAERRAKPRADDLISDLVAAADGQERLSHDEIVGTCVLLLMAGHEATVNVIGNGLNALLARPDQWAALIADPAVVPSAVEEMLRFDSALQLFERTAAADVRICDTVIPAGAKISALLGAANRDPRQFVEPDRFDVRRNPNQHLGFGVGIHFCLGGPLARVEIGSVMATLRDQLPGLQAADRAERRPEFVIRGLVSLPVRLSGD